MAKRLKQKAQYKLHKNQPDKGTLFCHNDKAMPLFSFAYMTTNQAYTFDFFGANWNDEIKTRKQLDRLLSELSTNTWLMLGLRNRYQIGGFETLRYDQIQFHPSGPPIPKDTNIFTFRFGQADAYRLLGYRINGCNVLYIIGYDFNFSAYNHGN